MLVRMLIVFVFTTVSLHAVGKTDAKNNVSPILDLIENLEKGDTCQYFKLLDTISYFSGRDSKLSLELGDALFTKVEELEITDKRVNILIQLIKQNFLTGNVSKAIEYLQLAFDTVEESDYKLLVSLYDLQGWIADEQERHGESQEAYFKGLSIAEKHNLYEDQIGFLSGIGITYADLDSMEQVYTYFYKALKIGKDQQLTSTLTYQNALYNLAGVLQHHNKKDSAIAIYKELEEICTKSNYISGLAAIANNMALLYMENEKFEQAINEAYKALEYDRKTGTQIYVIGDMYTIAKVFNAMGVIDSVVHYLEKGDSLCIKHNVFQKRLEITELLHSSYQKQGEYEKAYAALNEYIEVKDTLDFVAARSKVKEAETKYKNQAQERENTYLKEKEMQQREVIYIQLGFIILLIGSVLFALNLIIQRKKGQKRVQELNTLLAEKNQSLNKAVNTKDRLFSIVSHDLKGPIGNSYSLLKAFNAREDYNLKRGKIIMRSMEKDLGRSYQLLNNLLIWARNQFDGVDPQIKKVDVGALVAAVLDPLKAQARAKNIVFEQSISNSSLIKTDPEMLSFIIRNICSNAVKFSYKDSKILVEGKQEANYYLIQIKDYGVGMQPKQIQQLLKGENFTSTEGTESETGTGLGLMLANEFASLLDIAINLESTPGEGTTFTLQIPL